LVGWVSVEPNPRTEKPSIEVFFSTNVWSLQFGGIQVSTAAQNDDAVCPYNANWLPGIPPTCGEFIVKFYKIYKMATCCFRTFFSIPPSHVLCALMNFKGKIPRMPILYVSQVSIKFIFRQIVKIYNLS
jgi:hypothetical protein